MSKRVLLISYYFAPQNAIGAVRPTKLAKYLTRMGYDVTVLCGTGTDTVRDPLLQRDMAELAHVRTVRERSLLRWWKERALPPETPQKLGERAVLPEKALSEQAMAEAKTRGQEKPAAQTAKAGASPKSALRGRVVNALYLWLTDRADAAFARACFRTLHGMGEHFDVVLSTYGPLSAHTVARKAKRWKLADRWIADFRDEVTMPFPWQQWRRKRYVRGMRKDADAITGVTAGCLRVMGLEAFGQAIPNGFDLEDVQGLDFPPKRRDKLTFIHCGQMYGAQRDLSPLFRALRALANEGAVDLSRVELAYAGRDTGGFVEQATAAGVSACLRGYGYLPRDGSLKLQKSAHVLLLAAWNAPDRQGNLPGKFLEYLMLDTPVLCCVAGNLPNSEIADIMRRTGVGFCYKQAAATVDEPRLKAYVRSLWDAFEAGKPMPFAPERAQVNAFASQSMAEAFARVIDNV